MQKESIIDSFLIGEPS